METPQRKRRGRTVLRVALVLLLVVVLALGGLVLLVERSGVAGRVQQQVLADFSRRLDREITAGEPDIRFFPPVAVTLRELKVAGVGDAPLFHAPELDVRLALWPLVRSLGDEVRVRSVIVREPTATLVRLRDGRWDHQTLLEKWQAVPSERDVVLERFSLVGGQVQVVDLAAPGRPAALAVRGLSVSARGLEPGRPMSLEIGAEEPALDAELTVDSLPRSFAALRPEDWPSVEGKLELKDFSLAAVRGFLPAGAAQTLSGGRATLSARIDTQGQAYRASGESRITELRLRGEAASARARFAATVPFGRPADVKAEVSEFELTGSGTELRGQAELRGMEPPVLSFSVKGPSLDLGSLLSALPERPAEEAPPASEALLPAALRQRLSRAVVTGTVELGKVTAGALTATDLGGRATLRQGVLLFEEAGAALYGGRLEAGGTRINLAEEIPTWRLAARLDKVQLDDAFSQVGSLQPLHGSAAGTLDLTGRGLDWEALRQQLSGNGRMSMSDGRWTAIDLDGELRTRLSRVAQVAGRELPGGRNAEPGTPLRELAASFEVKDGWLHLARPADFEASFGRAVLGGRIALDQRIDLTGSAQLQPDFVRAATGGRFKPGSPVEVPLRVRGTLSQPAVEIDDAALARALVGDVRERVGRGVRDRLRESFGF